MILFKNIKIYFIVVLCLVFIATTFQCQKGQKLSEISQTMAQSLIEAKYSKKPSLLTTIVFSNKQYIAAVVNPTKLHILSSFANDWAEVFDYGGDIEGESIDSLQFVKIQGKLYCFYIFNSYGNSSGTSTYTLYGLNDKDTFEIETDYFSGNLGQIPQKVQLNSDILKFFESKISKSMHKNEDATKKYNQALPENAFNRWKVDNPNIYEKATISSVNIIAIRYQSNLCTVGNRGSVTDSVENEKYKIWVLFKDYCIAYNKQSKEYFVLWVPQSENDIFEKVTFNPNNTLRFVLDGAKYSINLDKMIVKEEVK